MCFCTHSLTHTRTHALTRSQHVSELSDIPGIAEDLSVEKENVSRTFAFKAFRCYHLAESYIGMQRWGEGVGLLDRALEHVTQATQHCQDLPQEPTLMGKVGGCVCEGVCVRV